MFAPAGTPPDVVEVLAKAVAGAVEAPDVRERLHAAGVVPATSTPPELARLVRRELAQYDALARDVGLVPATTRNVQAK